MRCRWHGLELRDRISNLQRLVPLEALKELLSLLLGYSLEADSIALALKDLQRWAIDNHLLVKILRFTVTTLIIK